MKLFNADTIYQIFPQNYSKVRIPKILQNYPFPFDLIFASDERTSLLRNRRFYANQILQNK